MVLGENIFVFDNIIDLNLQLELLNYYDTNYKNWHYFNKDISHGDFHEFYDYSFPGYSVDVNSKSKIDEKIVKIVQNIEKEGLRKINMEFLSNYRYKLSCYPPLNPLPPEEVLFRQIHTDKEIPHLVMVYYVNNTEGNTTVFRNKLGINQNYNTIVEKETITGNFTNVEKLRLVPPKQGRLVVFDGILLHSPGWPTKQNRYIINFNTIVKTENKNLI
jgi:anaerobic selenocysteine-containing dehydrogenase